MNRFKRVQKEGRVGLDCLVCDEGVDAPDNDFGRAVVKAFRAQHQHPEAAA